MKKLLLIVSTLTIGLTNINAQISVTDNLGNPISSGDVIHVVTTVGGLADENDFTIKNFGTSSKDYQVQRIDNELNIVDFASGDSAQAYFCFGINCYPASVTLLPAAFTMTANATQSLKTYLQEASTQGYSKVTYKIYDSNNIYDMFMFTISYNSSMNALVTTQLTDHLGNPVLNGTTLHVASTVGGLPDENDFTVKNAGTASKDYQVQRIDNELNVVDFASGDSASAYFCFGINCYPASVTLLPTAFTMSANATQSLKTYLLEASAQGYSRATYKVYDVNNTNDMFTFSLSYNTVMSVSENTSVLSSVSNIFPNPSVNKAQIIVNSKTNIIALVTITNALGTVVSSKNTELSSGKNNIQLDAENLSTGVYFASIITNDNKIVKKFTVNK